QAALTHPAVLTVRGTQHPLTSRTHSADSGQATRGTSIPCHPDRSEERASPVIPTEAIMALRGTPEDENERLFGHISGNRGAIFRTARNERSGGISPLVTPAEIPRLRSHAHSARDDGDE